MYVYAFDWKESSLAIGVELGLSFDVGRFGMIGTSMQLVHNF